MNPRELRLAYGAWALVCFFWGTTFVGIRLCLQTLPAVLFGGTRQLAAGVVLLALLLLRGVALPQGRDWLRLGALGIVLLGINNGVVVWSMQWLSAGTAALMVAMTPFWMVVLEALASGGEKLRWRQMGGLVLGFCGVVLLVGPELHASGFKTIVASITLQTACFIWALGSVYSRRLTIDVNPLMGAAVQLTLGGGALSLLGLALGDWRHFSFDGRTAAAFVYLMVFGSIVGYSAYTYALQRLPMSTISLYLYINPVIALLMGWSILGEKLGAREVAAVVTVLFGVALAKMPRRRALRAGAQRVLRAATGRGRELAHGEPVNTIEPLAASILQPAVDDQPDDEDEAGSEQVQTAEGFMSRPTTQHKDTSVKIKGEVVSIGHEAVEVGDDASESTTPLEQAEEQLMSESEHKIKAH